MAKKRTLDGNDMEKFALLLEDSAYQSEALGKILTAIQGDEDLGIEGMVAAQKRIEAKTTIIEESLDKRIGDIEKTIKDINDWKNAITLYLGVVTSKKLWKFLFVTTGIIVLIVLSFKYGILTVWQYIKNMVL